MERALSRTQKEVILSDGSRVIRCYTESCPQYFKDSYGNLQPVALGFSKSGSDKVSSLFLADKNVRSVGVRDDGSSHKYVGIRYDETQKSGVDQLEFSVSRIIFDGASIPIDMSSRTPIGNTAVDLGNIVVFATRSCLKQLVVKDRPVSDFQIDYVLHLKGLRIRNVVSEESEVLRKEVLPSFKTNDLSSVSGAEFLSFVKSLPDGPSLTVGYIADDAIFVGVDKNPDEELQDVPSTYSILGSVVNGSPMYAKGNILLVFKHFGLGQKTLESLVLGIIQSIIGPNRVARMENHYLHVDGKKVVGFAWSATDTDTFCLNINTADVSHAAPFLKKKVSLMLASGR